MEILKESRRYYIKDGKKEYSVYHRFEDDVWEVVQTIDSDGIYYPRKNWKPSALVLKKIKELVRSESDPILPRIKSKKTQVLEFVRAIGQKSVEFYESYKKLPLPVSISISVGVSMVITGSILILI